MVDGSMGLNLMMAGQRFSRRGLLGQSRACPASPLPQEHKRRPLAVTADSRRRGRPRRSSRAAGGRASSSKGQGSVSWPSQDG